MRRPSEHKKVIHTQAKKKIVGISREYATYFDSSVNRQFPVSGRHSIVNLLIDHVSVLTVSYIPAKNNTVNKNVLNLCVRGKI